MIPPDLFVLRQHMYQTNHDYLQAMIAYTVVRHAGRPTTIVLDAAQAWHAAAEQLDAALTVLLEYLEPLRQDAYWDKEVRQTQQVQRSLHRDLTLLQHRADDAEVLDSSDLQVPKGWSSVSAGGHPAPSHASIT